MVSYSLGYLEEGKDVWMMLSREKHENAKDVLESHDAARHARPIGHAHKLSRYCSDKGVLICAQG